MARTNTAEKIVTYATELFREKGYHASSMNDIAKGVGLKKASLYNHFRSKEMIAKAVVEAVGRELQDNVFDLAGDTSISAPQRLKDILERLYEYFRDKDACILASLSMGRSEDDELPIEAVKHFKQQWLNAFSTIFQSQYPKEKADQLAEESLVRIQGSLIVRRISDGSEGDILRRNIDEVTKLLN